MRYSRSMLAATIAITAFAFQPPADTWHSKFLSQKADGSWQYHADEKGNILPDFSRVGYYQGDAPLPDVPVVKTIEAEEGNSQQVIQQAIEEVSKRSPDQQGFRGAILLKKGVYKIPGTIRIQSSGIVLRGEGDKENGTVLVATGNTQRVLIDITGSGHVEEVKGIRVAITDEYVPVGAASFHVESTSGLKPGDPVILFRPGTSAWIKDLKMDAIDARDGTQQWQPAAYDLRFERVITRISGSTVFIDNPVVMALEKNYGGGYLIPYRFEGRLSKVGIEQLRCESTYASDTAEDHGWTAIRFNRTTNGWVRQVTSRYFGYSCVELNEWAKWITVTDCRSLDAKSKITGSRRYSFNNNGQQNLFMNCHTTEGRHDYVTGARTCGPNVFYNCTAVQTHGDIGPHHRWSAGTLYDNIITDGEINIQDRGNWGSGHGWAGVTQIVWNCTAKRAAVQSPWVNGKNYCIGLTGQQYDGRLRGRPNGEWEGQNKKGLQPPSLYMVQLQARKK